MKKVYALVILFSATLFVARPTIGIGPGNPPPAGAWTIVDPRGGEPWEYYHGDVAGEGAAPEGNLGFTMKVIRRPVILSSKSGTSTTANGGGGQWTATCAEPSEGWTNGQGGYVEADVKIFHQGSEQTSVTIKVL